METSKHCVVELPDSVSWREIENDCCIKINQISNSMPLVKLVTSCLHFDDW